MNKIYNRVSILSLIGASMLSAIFVVGCTSSDVDSNLPTPSVKSMSVWTTDDEGVVVEYPTTIDLESRSITIDDLENGESITNVTYETPDGVTLSPAPNIFISKWSENNFVKATNGSESIEYNICFENYVAPDDELLEIKGLDVDYTINLNNYKQQVMFCGGDMERTQSFLIDIVNPSTVVQWLYSDINWSICRVSFDKQQELVEGEKNFAFYNDLITSMKMLLQANPHLEFWATLKSDYNGYGSSNNLPEWICSYPHPGNKWKNESSNKSFYFNEDKFIVYVANFVEYMEKSGTPMAYFSFSKEWGAYFNAWRTTYCVLGLREECKDRGVTMPKITDPSAWSLGEGNTFITNLADLDADGDITYSGSSVKALMSKAVSQGRLSDYGSYTTEAGRTVKFDYKSMDCFALYHGFSAHDYQAGTDWADFAEKAAYYGKPIFGDETGAGAGGAMKGKEAIISRRMYETYLGKMEAYNGGLAGELFFEPTTSGSESPSGNRTVLGENGVARRMRAYYPMMEFSNMIVPRNNMPNLSYPNYINPDNKWVVESGVVSSSSIAKYMAQTKAVNGTTYPLGSSSSSFNYIYDTGDEYTASNMITILAFANSIDSPDVNGDGREVVFMVVNYTDEYTKSNSVKITLGDFQLDIDGDRKQSMRCYDDDYVFAGLGSTPEVSVSGVVATVELGAMPPQSLAFVRVPIK